MLNIIKKKNEESDYRCSSVAFGMLLVTAFSILFAVILATCLNFMDNPEIVTLNDDVYYNKKMVAELNTIDLESLEKDVELQIIESYSSSSNDYIILKNPDGEISKFKCLDGQLDVVEVGDTLTKSDLNSFMVESKKSNNDIPYFMFVFPLVPMMLLNNKKKY